MRKNSNRLPFYKIIRSDDLPEAGRIKPHGVRISVRALSTLCTELRPSRNAATINLWGTTKMNWFLKQLPKKFIKPCQSTKMRNKNANKRSNRISLTIRTPRTNCNDYMLGLSDSGHLRLLNLRFFLIFLFKSLLIPIILIIFNFVDDTFLAFSTIFARPLPRFLPLGFFWSIDSTLIFKVFLSIDFLKQALDNWNVGIFVFHCMIAVKWPSRIVSLCQFQLSIGNILQFSPEEYGSRRNWSPSTMRRSSIAL